jgi:FXSXX-COOH protein
VGQVVPLPGRRDQLLGRRHRDAVMHPHLVTERAKRRIDHGNGSFGCSLGMGAIRPYRGSGSRPARRRPAVREENEVDEPLAGTVCEVPDVSNLPMYELLALDESALGPALRRLRREADHPEEVLAGFNSAV